MTFLIILAMYFIPVFYSILLFYICSRIYDFDSYDAKEFSMIVFIPVVNVLISSLLLIGMVLSKIESIFPKFKLYRLFLRNRDE